MSSVQVGPQSCQVTCPACGATVATRIQSKATTRTHRNALFMFYCLPCLICSWLPYCMKSCQNTDHYCPNCGAFMGSYAR